MGNEEDAERFDEVLRGPSNLSGAINVAEYTAQYNLQPDNEWPARGYNAKNIWYEENGAVIQSLKPNATLAELTTDGAQTDSRVSVEGPVTIYQPGTEISASAGLFVDTLPTGDAIYEVKYGREPRTITDPYTGTGVGVGVEFAGFEVVEDPDSERSHDLEFVVGTDVDGDGTAEVNRIPITNGDWKAEEFIQEFDTAPKAEVYGKDPLDGSGPSAIRYDATNGYLYGLEIGWYAPTALTPYVVETTNVNGTYKERKHPILIYQPKEGPAIRRPNQPIRVAADAGTSGQDLQARLGGRFGGYRGRLKTSPAPDTTEVYGQDVLGDTGTTGTEGLNWSVVAVVKARAVDPDTVVIPKTPSYTPDNPATTMVRLARESDLSGTIEYDEPSNTARADVEFAIDAAPDTPDRLDLGTATIDGETKFVGQKVGGDMLQADKNTPTLSQGDRDIDFVIPRDLVLVYMVASRDTTTDIILDAVYDFTVAG